MDLSVHSEFAWICKIFAEFLGFFSCFPKENCELGAPSAFSEAQSRIAAHGRFILSSSAAPQSGRQALVLQCQG